MVTIKLFAMIKDKAGRDELLLDVTDSTVTELLQHIAREIPALGGIVSARTVRVSINSEFASLHAVVRDGDEVALMPPFSGGDTDGPQPIRIQKEPFSVDDEIGRIKGVSQSIGAVVTFLGTTRDVSRGKQVSKLDFEHYPGMAEKKLAEIRKRAIKDYGIVDVTIIHRTGTLPVGENIVLIVVAAEHREEAFNACRFCIDELKRITPIWKRETTPDGEVWVEEHP